MNIVPQTKPVVKKEALYQLNTIELLDHALARANHHRAQFLATGSGEHWRLWQACLQDRLDLLGQVEGEDHVT